jgi:hypothetical protein
MASNFRANQDSLHSLLTWFLSPKSRGLETEDGPHAAAMIAKHLSLGYQALVKPSGMPVNSVSVDVPELNVERYRAEDSEFLKPVLELRDVALSDLRPYLQNFFVHGSIATMDFVKGWSDFDTFAILKDSTAQNEGELLQLRKILVEAAEHLFQIDPLQHHYFLVCTEFDLAAYPAKYLPPQALVLGSSYYQAVNLTLHLLDTAREEQASLQATAAFFENTAKSGILRHHAYRGEYLLSEWQNSERGMYSLKYLLGTVALAPALYYSAIGRPTDKASAIDEIKNSLSERSRSTLEMTSRIRFMWPDRESAHAPSVAIPDWIRYEVGPGLFQRIAEFHRELADKALQSPG